jgi:hypothetical protein
MTGDELLTKREAILNSLGIARVQFGERSVEYSRQSDALAVVDREIANQSPGDKVFTFRTKRGLQ